MPTGPICGIISHSGPQGEPLACAYLPGHEGIHSWGTLPTWTTRSLGGFRMVGGILLLTESVAEVPPSSVIVDFDAGGICAVMDLDTGETFEA